MLLIGLAILVVVGALVALAVTIVRTWHTVRGLSRDVAAAGERVADASAALEAASAPRNGGR